MNASEGEKNVMRKDNDAREVTICWRSFKAVLGDYTMADYAFLRSISSRKYLFILSFLGMNTDLPYLHQLTVYTE